jgi:hypothetical protein
MITGDNHTGRWAQVVNLMVLNQHNTQLQHLNHRSLITCRHFSMRYETVLDVLTMKTMNLDCDGCFSFRTVTKQERYSLMLTHVHRFLRLKPT